MDSPSTPFNFSGDFFTSWGIDVDADISKMARPKPRIEIGFMDAPSAKIVAEPN